MKKEERGRKRERRADFKTNGKVEEGRASIPPISKEQIGSMPPNYDFPMCEGSGV